MLLAMAFLSYFLVSGCVGAPALNVDIPERLFQQQVHQKAAPAGKNAICGTALESLGR